MKIICLVKVSIFDNVYICLIEKNDTLLLKKYSVGGDNIAVGLHADICQSFFDSTIKYVCDYLSISGKHYPGSIDSEIIATDMYGRPQIYARMRALQGYMWLIDTTTSK